MLTHDSRKTRQQNPLTILLRLYPILVISLILLNISCSRQITEPIDDATPGRRDYVWTVDTITTDPFVNVSRMWGSGSNDLWTVGYYLHHFDGTFWSLIKGFYPSAIFGFAQNDVWAVCNGKKAQFFHFDGQQWSLFSGIYNSDSSYMCFNNIWGDAPNNIYAVGFSQPSSTEYKQLILHYDGKKWSTVSAPDMRFIIYDVRVSGNKLIFTGSNEETYASTYKVLEFDGVSFKGLYSGTDDAEMSSIYSTIYFYIGKKVYQYHNGYLHLYKDWNSINYIGGFWGRSEKDVFVGTVDSAGCYAINHYNGDNIMTLITMWGKRIGFYNCQLYEKEVAFLGCDYNSGVTFCIHGKLPN
jgi:hypothetical protein